MSYEIPVPYRDRDQPLVDARADLRDAPLAETETELAREVIDQALFVEGERTVGQLLDRLDRADPDQRREVLDRARAALGQPSVAEVERRRDLARARRDDPPPPPSRRATGPPRDARGRAWQSCADPECEVVPTEAGAPAPVRAVRWWCPTHRDQAAPGDLDPWQAPVLRFGRAGLEQELTAEDRRYYADLERERKEADRDRAEQRRAEHEATERARERWQRENPGDDVMGVPMSRIRVEQR